MVSKNARKRVDAQGIVPPVDNRTDVTGLESVGPDSFEDGLVELRYRVGDIHSVHFAGVEEAFDVRFQTEDGRSPGSLVGPKSLEQRAAIMDDVGGDVDTGILPGNELAVHPHFSILAEGTHSALLRVSNGFLSISLTYRNDPSHVIRTSLLKSIALRG